MNPYQPPRSIEKASTPKLSEASEPGLPFYRRSGFCTTFVGLHAAALVSFCCVSDGGFGLLAEGLTTLGLTAVVVIMDSGPICYGQDEGEPRRRWSWGHRIVVSVLLLMTVAQMSFLLWICWLVRQGA